MDSLGKSHEGGGEDVVSNRTSNSEVGGASRVKGFYQVRDPCWWAEPSHC